MNAPLQLETMDDLITELSLGSARGGAKRGAAVSIEVVRSLSEADIPLLNNPPPVGSKPSIPELRHQHHQLAALIAKGCGNAEISAITGYSGSYLSILRSAPDMQELVAYYAAQTEEHTVDALARLRQLGITAAEELQRRLNEEPEKFSPSMLRDLTETGIIKPVQIGAFAAAGARNAAAGGGVQINLNFKAPAASGAGSIIDVIAEAAE